MGSETDVLITAIGLTVVAYLCGSVPSGLWYGLIIHGKDVRDFGSRKTGATNVLRVFGKAAAFAVIALDASKAIISVGLARYVLPDDAWVHVLAALAAVVGHTWPVFARFRGGRGVLVAAFSILVMDPEVFLVALTIFITVAWWSKYVSLASLVSAIDVPTMFALRLFENPDYPLPYLAFGLVAGFFVIATHRDNIGRIRAGREAKLGERVPTTSQG